MMFFKCLVFWEHDFYKQVLQRYSSYEMHEQCIKTCDHVEFPYYVDSIY